MRLEGDPLVVNIALGTAQFGLQYGIANRTGKVAGSNVQTILNSARAAGITVIDTAMAYGESEAVLGGCGVRDLNVVSKLPEVPCDRRTVDDWISARVEESLGRLRIDCLYGLLLHRPVQLSGPDGEKIAQSLCRLKHRGYVKKIGVSVYGPDDIEHAYKLGCVDIVQIPFNIFDRRILNSGWLDRLATSGTEVHARSVFLQGLLLMKESEIPGKFDKWRSIFTEWHSWLDSRRISALMGCLSFVRSFPKISNIVVGIDSPKHLTEILQAFSDGRVSEVCWPDVQSRDELLLNPSNWSKL